MKLFTDVTGLKVNGRKIIQRNFDVRITNDNYGISLSICDMKEDVMYQIPITKSMLRELMKDVD